MTNSSFQSGPHSSPVLSSFRHSSFRHSSSVLLSSFRHWSFVILTVLCAGGPSTQGQTTQAATEPAASARERAIQAFRLQGEIVKLFQDGKYQEAAEKCREFVQLDPRQPTGHYNLACALARLGKVEEAFASLGKSIALGYDEPGHMREDEDLEALRKDKRFEELAAKARENEKIGGGKYEKGAEIKGVKTLEDSPEGCLRYRLRMGENASQDKPNRLIVWLHPSGGSMNGTVEGLSPLFIKKGFALVVFTQKNFVGWSGEDLRRLQKTLKEVAKVKGIDAARPILMGFSAGGQAALELWAENGGAYGGLVLDAAYPMDAQQYNRGKVALRKLPADEAAKKVPMFVLVGEQDGGSRLWKSAQQSWAQAGVPLTVHYVPDKGHQWLFGKAQVTELEKWLEQVAAGKLPSQPASAPANSPATSPATRPSTRPRNTIWY